MWGEGYVRGGRTGFGFSVADYDRDDEVLFVHYCAEGYAERVSEFSTFVDTAGDLRVDVAGESTGGGEVGDEVCETSFIEGVLLGVKVCY